MSRWVQRRRDRWYLRMFGERLHALHLWSLNRRDITAAFGAGIAIGFVPLPVHAILCVVVAIVARINLPMTLLSSFMFNPLTIVPLYYLAYRMGAWLLQQPPQEFAFEMSWEWLEYGLGPLWRPFLLGCMVCGLCGAFLGRWALEWIWRATVRHRFRHRARRGASA